ncbi:hypothetical protein TWF102_003957 [Orbilia oligospora]|uniref:Uncharacterized protein n=1 Tax=Orbilia oligospora TaxID=2813651 RepID=A0A7C8NIE4_ORBOL|nr:hypothetical protein TWF102_003957 [Orbilia oligospora]
MELRVRVPEFGEIEVILHRLKSDKYTIEHSNYIQQYGSNGGLSSDSGRLEALT